MGFQPSSLKLQNLYSESNEMFKFWMAYYFYWISDLFPLKEQNYDTKVHDEMVCVMVLIFKNMVVLVDFDVMAQFCIQIVKLYKSLKMKIKIICNPTDQHL